MTLGVTSTGIAPLLLTSRAIASEPTVSKPTISQPIIVAQVFSQPSPVNLRAGTAIPTRYDQAEKIVVTPTETSNVTLTVASDIRSVRGTVIIPTGSTIEGELRPAEGGTQFVAQTLVLPNGHRYPISATSAVVTRTQTVTKNSNPDFLKGAVIGAAAAAVLSDIFGNINFIEVLAGAGLGALASVLLRGREETQVVVVYPTSDLDLTLQSDFMLSSVSSSPTRSIGQI